MAHQEQRGFASTELLWSSALLDFEFGAWSCAWETTEQLLGQEVMEISADFLPATASLQLPEGSPGGLS